MTVLIVLSVCNFYNFFAFVDYSKHIMATFHEIDSLPFVYKTLSSLIVLSIFSAFFKNKERNGKGKDKGSKQNLKQCFIWVFF